MAKVRISTKTHNLGSLKRMVEVGMKNAEKAAVVYAETILRTAAERTPRYSGQATLAWRLSLSPTTGSDIVPNEWTGQAPAFQDGIMDSKSPTLIETLVQTQLKLKTSLITKLRSSGEVKLYLYNAAPYAQTWLGNQAGVALMLRDVNQEYWDMQEIVHAVGLRSKNLKF